MNEYVVTASLPSRDAAQNVVKTVLENVADKTTQSVLVGHITEHGNEMLTINDDGTLSSMFD